MEPITVEFPLRGDWTAGHTPAEKVPSHGVDVLGQTYAYDFLRLDWNKKGFIFHPKTTLRYYTTGLNVKDCFGYGEHIYSPVNGKVVVSKDGLKDHQWLHPIKDLLAAYARGLYISLSKKPNLHKVIGNYIIVKMEDFDAYVFFAHAKKDSIMVKEGEVITCGQHLADVGNTGNSTAPHLHFHIMDRIDLLNAKGLPCNFKEYESFSNDSWTTKINGIPEKRERIRVKNA
ncbi:MAG: M23 family metallopeptidase [Gammaproteobacteria bacterium]|nr:M23 family metallopeptidase [Gammaproteobacteria bacterium]